MEEVKPAPVVYVEIAAHLDELAQRTAALEHRLTEIEKSLIAVLQAVRRLLP